MNSGGAISRDMKTAAKSDGGRSEIGKQRFTKLCPKGLKLRTTRDRNKQLLSSGSIPCDIDASGQTDSRREATRPRPPGVIPTIYQIQWPSRVRAANISTGIRFTCKMPASYNTVPRIFQQTSFLLSTWKPSILVVIDRKSVNEFYRKSIKLIFVLCNPPWSTRSFSLSASPVDPSTGGTDILRTFNLKILPSWR